MPLLGDPSSYHYGVTLRQPQIAPDGGSVQGYLQRKKDGYLPTPTPEQEAYYQFFYRDDLDQLTRFPTITDRMKSFGQVVEAMDRLNDLSFVPSTQQYHRDPNAPRVHQQKVAKYKKVISDHFYSIAVKPLEELREKQKAREEEEQRQTIATLKMRVQELTKKPIDVPTAPAVTTSPTSYLPLAVVGIVVVVILLFLRRRA